MEISLTTTQAIRDALDRDVDIVSMSWTLKLGNIKNNADSYLEDLNSAVADAKKDGKYPPLMFCAASDDRPETSSRLDDDFHRKIAGYGLETFCIGAAESGGETWSNVTDKNYVDYVFPGVNINRVVDDSSLEASKREALTDNGDKTGSSIATAFAAGLAALLIHCTRLAIYHQKAMTVLNEKPAENLEEDLGDKIATYQTMKLALDQLAIENQAGNKFANPRTDFKAATTNLNKFREGVDANLPQSLGPIAHMVRDLCKKRNSV
jgi:hypothetical protein